MNVLKLVEQAYISIRWYPDDWDIVTLYLAAMVIILVDMARGLAARARDLAARTRSLAMGICASPHPVPILPAPFPTGQFQPVLVTD